jgi:hypothetical protein
MNVFLRVIGRGENPPPEFHSKCGRPQINGLVFMENETKPYIGAST